MRSPTVSPRVDAEVARLREEIAAKDAQLESHVQSRLREQQLCVQLAARLTASGGNAAVTQEPGSSTELMLLKSELVRQRQDNTDKNLQLHQLRSQMSEQSNEEERMAATCAGLMQLQALASPEKAADAPQQTQSLDGLEKLVKQLRNDCVTHKQQAVTSEQQLAAQIKRFEQLEWQCTHDKQQLEALQQIRPDDPTVADRPLQSVREMKLEAIIEGLQTRLSAADDQRDREASASEQTSSLEQQKLEVLLAAVEAKHQQQLQQALAAKDTKWRNQMQKQRDAHELELSTERQEYQVLKEDSTVYRATIQLDSRGEAENSKLEVAVSELESQLAERSKEVLEVECQSNSQKEELEAVIRELEAKLLEQQQSIDEQRASHLMESEREQYESELIIANLEKKVQRQQRCLDNQELSKDAESKAEQEKLRRMVKATKDTEKQRLQGVIAELEASLGRAVKEKTEWEQVAHETQEIVACLSKATTNAPEVQSVGLEMCDLQPDKEMALSGERGRRSPSLPSHSVMVEPNVQEDNQKLVVKIAQKEQDVSALETVVAEVEARLSTSIAEREQQVGTLQALVVELQTTLQASEAELLTEQEVRIMQTTQWDAKLLAAEKFEEELMAELLQLRAESEHGGRKEELSNSTREFELEERLLQEVCRDAKLQGQRLRQQ